ncbi:hypothetical protein XENORESO_020600 [Xenotaenia resolanae]|uniref:Prolactin receptor n=1 Tax=Xenotaenia resolanae TaxID=208358 RepID=A0ABV0X1U6_9TELE
MLMSQLWSHFMHTLTTCKEKTCNFLPPPQIYHPSIVYTRLSLQGGGLGKRMATPWTSPQSITGEHSTTQDKQPFMNTHSHLKEIKRDLLMSHDFGLWEEAGVPGKNPHLHEENMKTPGRKTPGQDLNPGPSCCKAIGLPTVSLCSPQLYHALNNCDGLSRLGGRLKAEPTAPTSVSVRLTSGFIVL